MKQKVVESVAQFYVSVYLVFKFFIKINLSYFIASEANLNIRAVFLHVLADALGSVIVIISALLNMFKDKLGVGENIRYVDPSLW